MSVLECENCGSADLELFGESGVFWGHCRACGYDGPDLPDYEPCGECGFDHAYEQDEAVKAHGGAS